MFNADPLKFGFRGFHYCNHPSQRHWTTEYKSQYLLPLFRLLNHYHDPVLC